MFEEQVAWAAEAGADFVIGETFSWLGEALVATEVIKAAGLTAVVTLTVHRHGNAREGASPAEACRQLEAAGADVVGINCGRGPATILPMLEEVRAAVSVPVAGLPVPYRTTESNPTFHSLRDPGAPDPAIAERPFPIALEPFTCSRFEIADFTRAAREIGVDYLGVCCGAAPHHIRAMAEALGRTPPASRYSADMSKHYAFGSDPSLQSANQEYAERM
jgi:betaine-homocysteine S-methyltransferase